MGSTAMKILLSWLNNYAEFGDDVDALAAAMTSLGLVVDDVEHIGATVDGVVTARVVRTEAHPDAARVHRVYVDTGDGVERHVWCGAFNMQAGDVVPLAVIGTTMADGQTIERRGILGIDSEGMLCSARELGLGDDHAGILILPPDSPLGVPYGDVLGVEPDVLFDVDVTRNRPDCWGYVGVARDLAAHLGLELRVPAPELDDTGEEHRADVEIVAGDRCGRFTSTVMSGVVVGPSADVDAAPPHGGRDATDQQRRRRQQLRDARAQPAEPRVRPRHARLRSATAGVPHPAGGRGRDDDDARRQRADVHRRRSLDLRRRRPADRRRRRDGRARHRDHRRRRARSPSRSPGSRRSA